MILIILPNNMIKILYGLILIVVIVLAIGCKLQNDISKSVEDNAKVFNDAKDKILSAKPTTVVETPITAIKNEVSLPVPFAVQFPAGTLDYPYQEGCEEASIIMAKAYFDGNSSDTIPNNEVDNTLLSMVDWQNLNWGGHYDLDATQTLDLMQKYYKISNGQVVLVSSIDDIKRLLSEDKIIVAPTYGMKLENPYFTAPGPAYHMLIIKGYNDTQFITNDPGVGVGKDFTYSYDNLFDAIHDLPAEAKNIEHYIKNHHELMQNSPKYVITIEK